MGRVVGFECYRCLCSITRVRNRNQNGLKNITPWIVCILNYTTNTTAQNKEYR